MKLLTNEIGKLKEKMKMNKTEELKQFVIIYKSWVVGGYEFLCMRICTQFLKKGYDALVFFEEMDSKIKDEMRLRGIKTVHIDKWWDLSEIKRKIGTKQTYILTSTINDYLQGRCISSRKIKSVFYMTLDTTLNILKGDYFENTNFYLTKRMLDIEIKHHHICVMNKHCYETAEEFYKNNNWKNNMDIIRIGVELPDFNKENAINRARERNELNVLSISRADFPTKGYLIGLLEFFSEYVCSYPVNVTIISYGPDFDLLCSRRDELSFPSNVHIRILDKINNDKLFPYFDRSNLYIGMGTSVIDAAQYGIVSVPIQPYTYVVSAAEFFSCENCELGNLTDNNRFESLVNSVMDMTEKEYLELSLNARKATESIYNIQNTSELLEQSFERVMYNKSSIRVFMLFWFRKSVHSIKVLLSR